MRVAIIVDDLDPARRRRCFWEEQLSSVSDVQYELIGLVEKTEERRFFNVFDYDVVIFNWCVLDGSPMYASDRVRDIVNFYDDYFFEFVRNGGVLIIENQPKRWRPIQAGYDVLLRGEVTVIPRQMYLFGSEVAKSARLRKHPLFLNLPDVLQSDYAHPLEESWFPFGSTSDRSMRELNPTKIYSGAFRSWSSDWLPLLYTADKRFPVMLVKTEGHGLWVVTTMYIASSNIKELVECLVKAKRHIVEIRSFHARQRYLQKLAIARVFAIVSVVALAIYFLFATRVVVTDIPYGNTVAGNVVLSVSLAVAVSLLTFLRKYIWQSWRDGFNK